MSEGRGKSPGGSGPGKPEARTDEKRTDEKRAGKWKPESCFPPGYEYEKERNAAILLLGIGITFSLQFFRSLYQTWEALYVYTDRARVLREDAVAAPFGKLVTGHWGLYVPLLMFLAAMAGYHYLYYYRDTRSIYLMRRLPGRWTVLKSCAAGPLLGMGLTAVILSLLYLMYYGMYLLVIPKSCRL